ncbi:MAG: c-type cytochrome [Phaeodactylibacter sp.]|nr:c-type cytochrome [Phaeodactylibacter sp.]MCB9287185.1 c-type cytochrome [Lewinellaceae bacterium]
MKKILKIVVYIFGAIAILAGAVAAYIQFAPAPVYGEQHIPEITFESTPEKVAEGARIASMLCNECHTGDDGRLSGKLLNDVPPAFGKFYSANITQDPDNGIGKWTDAELYYFLRTGLRQDGTFAAVMPQFPQVSDEDLFSIIAFLRSDERKVQPSEKPSQASAPALLGNMLLKFILKPSPYPEAPVPQPDTLDQIAWGRYLANGLYSCYDCHSASFTTNDRLIPENSKGFYGGGNELLDIDGNPIYSANLTPDRESGIGRYSERDFIQALKYGMRPDGAPLQYPMRPHTALTDNEVKAIFAYLRSIPPISHTVARASAGK